MRRRWSAMLLAVLSVALIAPGCAWRGEVPSFYQRPPGVEPYRHVGGEKVTNVILCIGDGMGFGQIVLARAKGREPGGCLSMERMPLSGIVRTHSADSAITDSAAAGTALASGVKTNNGMLGMTPDGTPWLNILEAAQRRGMRTGLVVTSGITHATPAAFGSHVRSRGMRAEIAEQLLATKIDVLLGGGRKDFLPQTVAGSGRTDERDLIREAKDAGYTYVTDAAGLQSARGPLLLGLFQVGPLSKQPPEPTLAELTREAIRVLGGAGDDAGFFLMVEGSQIDWACHSNDADSAAKHVLDFDEAVESVMAFAMRDGETLVIVTADHETGGLRVSGAEGGGLEVSWSTGGHTDWAVPIFAFGPGAKRFRGDHDNTEIARQLARALGIAVFPAPLRPVEVR